MSPAVCFLLPIAAPAPYLRATLQSILAQSISEWHVVAVLDGPARDAEHLLRETIPSSRLTLVSNSQRMGISTALNTGLRHVNSTWIARIDADDINRPDRLKHQLRAAGTWSDAVVIGGSAGLIDEEGGRLGALTVAEGADIRRSLLLRNQIIHSAAFIKTAAITAIGGYSPSCHLREDYELWLRLAAVGPVANVRGEVIDYRLGPHQTSRGTATAQAYREVQRARRLAAAALGYPRWSAWWRGVAWRAGQSAHAQNNLGRLSEFRKVSGR